MKRNTELLINIDVSDLQAAVGFYREAFDLEVGRRIGEGAVELLGAPAPIWLLLNPPGSAAVEGQAPRRDYGRHWTPVHLDFVCDEIKKAVDRAIQAGARLESAVSDEPYGRLALMSDPFGNGFCLIEFVGRGYDSYG